MPMGKLIRNQVETIARDRRGTTAITYGLTAAVIVLIVMGSGISMPSEVRDLYSKIEAAAAPYGRWP